MSLTTLFHGKYQTYKAVLPQSIYLTIIYIFSNNKQLHKFLIYNYMVKETSIKTTCGRWQVQNDSLYSPCV